MNTAMIDEIEFPETAIRNLDNKVITFRCVSDAKRAAELATAFIGDKFEAKWQKVENSHSIPYLSGQDDYYKAPTLPERAVIAAFSWYVENHAPGLQNDAELTFPKILENSFDCEDATEPMVYVDEARAYAFAEACTKCFGVSATVSQVNRGWVVSVKGKFGNQLSRLKLAKLQGVGVLLGRYNIVRAPEVVTHDANQTGIIYPSSEAREDFSRQEQEHLTRIEIAVNAILARLETPANTNKGKHHSDPKRSAKAAQNDVFSEITESGDTHRLPGKQSRKPVKKA